MTFKAYGREAQATTVLGVLPRETGIWTQSHWESQITYDSAQASVSCPQLPSRPVWGAILAYTGALSGGGTGCEGQQIETGGGGGFDLNTVSSGPNDGAVWVADASFYSASASQITPGALPGAAGATLVDSTQANDCRAALQLPPGPVTINFWDFNNDCRPVPGWSGFIPAVWVHERGHFEQAEDALHQPMNNIYTVVEKVVEGGEAEAIGEITRIYNDIQAAVEVAGPPHPTGNWTTDYWPWLDTTVNLFAPLSDPNF